MPDPQRQLTAPGANWRGPGRSLRTRLTLVVLASLTVLLAVGGAATYELTRRSLMDRIDGQVAGVGAPPVRALVRLPATPGEVAPAALDPTTPRALRADVLVAVVGRRSTFLMAPTAGAAEAPEEVGRLPGVPDDLRAQVLAARGPVLLTVTLPEGDYRVAARAVPGTQAVVLFGQPLRDVQATVSRLLLILGAVGLAVLAVAAAATLVIIRVGLRPLDRVVAVADGIAAGDMSARVGMDHGPREVARVSRAFDAMLGRIEEAFRRRRESEDRVRRFAADASHELRTPLTSIRGHAELWRRPAAVAADRERAMRRIEEESLRMSGIVDSLLVLARLDDAVPAGFGAVWLDPLLRDVVDGARASHPAHDIVVETDGQAVAHGDEEQLRRAVTNLVTNAVTHTPPGTRVEIGLRRDGGDVVLTVRDHGPGLPEGDPDELFGRFVRGDAGRSRANGGSGLGLAIVRGVARHHDGTVTAAPAEGGGAVFTLRIPREPVAASV